MFGVITNLTTLSFKLIFDVIIFDNYWPKTSSHRSWFLCVFIFVLGVSAAETKRRRDGPARHVMRPMGRLHSKRHAWAGTWPIRLDGLADLTGPWHSEWFQRQIDRPLCRFAIAQFEWLNTHSAHH